MGITVISIIKHDLGVDELISLPELINGRKIDSPVKKKDEEWKWTREKVDGEFLKEYWSRHPLWYAENKWSESDLAVIEGPENFSITLYDKHAAIIRSLFKWSAFKESEEVNSYFKSATLWLCKILNANQAIITHELSLNDLDESEEASWEKIIEVFQGENIEFEIIKTRDINP